MVSLVTVPSAASGVKRVRISVPLVEPLLDGQKYFLESELPAPEREDLRPLHRPKLHRFARPVKGARPSGQLAEQRDLTELAEMLGDP